MDILDLIHNLSVGVNFFVPVRHILVRPKLNSLNLGNKGSVKNNLVEFAPKFAVDLIDLIEQNRRNSELFRGLLRMRIG